MKSTTTRQGEFPETRLLAAARTTTEFRRACTELLGKSKLVRLDSDRVAEDLIVACRQSGPVSWSWYLSDSDSASLEQAAFELAINAGLNGGYFWREGNRIRQWAEAGSGSQRLVTWIAELREAGLMPGLQIDDPAMMEALLPAFLEGVPHAADRLAACRDFADPRLGLRFRNFIGLLLSADSKPWRFELRHADWLARLWPEAFGGDPFRKKAILFLQMFAGWLQIERGTAVNCDLPIPADYQIPRILHHLGVLRTTPAVDARLTEARLLHVLDPLVTSLRAAAVLGAGAIAARAGVDDAIVDGVLFTQVRGTAEFEAQAPNPMRCSSFWF